MMVVGWTPPWLVDFLYPPPISTAATPNWLLLGVATLISNIGGRDVYVCLSSAMLIPKGWVRS